MIIIYLFKKLSGSSVGIFKSPCARSKFSKKWRFRAVGGLANSNRRRFYRLMLFCLHLETKMVVPTRGVVGIDLSVAREGIIGDDGFDRRRNWRGDSNVESHKICEINCQPQPIRLSYNAYGCIWRDGQKRPHLFHPIVTNVRYPPSVVFPIFSGISNR